MDNSKIIECQNCHKELTEEEKPCPNCGSTQRLYKVNLHETITTYESLKLKQQDQSGFVLGTSIYREKKSGKTKRRATESLVYDRRDPNYTKKLHHVEEINEKGEKEVVHHHEEQYPAKRRKGK